MYGNFDYFHPRCAPLCLQLVLHQGSFRRMCIVTLLAPLQCQHFLQIGSLESFLWWVLLVMPKLTHQHSSYLDLRSAHQTLVARKMSLYNVLLYWDIFLATRLRQVHGYRVPLVGRLFSFKHEVVCRIAWMIFRSFQL